MSSWPNRYARAVPGVCTFGQFRSGTDHRFLWSVMPRQTTMAFTRRHLPHWIPEETVVFVTWRLAGSLPVQARAPAAEQRGQTPFLQHDERLDLERSGPTWLQDSRVASIVANALLYGETVRRYYQLHGWVVMPNHVHAILQPHTALPTIMRWLKGRTSRVANQIFAGPGHPSGKTSHSTIGYGPGRNSSI